MERDACNGVLPSIPNFHCMSLETLKYHTSKSRRDETAALRKQILSSRRASSDDKEMDKISLGHSRKAVVPDTTSPCRSAPVAGARQNPEAFRFIHHHRNAKSTNGKARSAPLNPTFGYLAKEVFKRPELERPPYFVKVHTDLQPVFEYPSGVLSSPECFFTKVSAINNNTDPNSQSARHKINPNINNLLKEKHVAKNSTHNNSQINKDLSSPCDKKYKTVSYDYHLRSSSPVKVDKQNRAIRMSAKDVCHRLHTDTNHVTFNGQSNRSNGGRPSSSSQTVNTFISHTQPFTSPTKPFSEFAWNDNESKILLELKRNNFKEMGVESDRRCREDVTKVTPKMRSRHHFINPEWSSEVVGWARYSHPTTHYACRFSWI